jgi:hypothetical protein
MAGAATTLRKERCSRPQAAGSPVNPPPHVMLHESAMASECHRALMSREGLRPFARRGQTLGGARGTW